MVLFRNNTVFSSFSSLLIPALFVDFPSPFFFPFRKPNQHKHSSNPFFWARDFSLDSEKQKAPTTSLVQNFRSQLLVALIMLKWIWQIIYLASMRTQWMCHSLRVLATQKTRAYLPVLHLQHKTRCPLSTKPPSPTKSRFSSQSRGARATPTKDSP